MRFRSLIAPRDSPGHSQPVPHRDEPVDDLSVLEAVERRHRPHDFGLGILHLAPFQPEENLIAQTEPAALRDGGGAAQRPVVRLP